MDSLIDALLVQNNQEKLGNVLKPILHFVIVLHVLALAAWIVLLVRQKPPRVRDKVDLSKDLSSSGALLSVSLAFVF